MTTKVHPPCDALGRPLRLLLTPGQAVEITSAPALLAGIRAKGAIADRAYDANPFRALLAAAGMEAVISSKRNRKETIAHDATIYLERNRIERCFQQAQALPAHRYPLRPARSLLFRLPASRGHPARAALHVDSA